MEEIRIESLVKTFGEVRALDGPSLTIRAGELFFLLGASGCGKTTLLRCLAGLETPDAGTIHMGAREVTGLPPHQRETALVFQNYALWPHLTAGQNIAFGLEERRLPKMEIRARVAQALETVRLTGFENRAIDQMSGGQQQRVSLARALVVQPKCLLLDEPLSNLDAQLRVEMRLEIRRIVQECGLTGIYVTHDQEEALAMADRMAVLQNGRIAQTGTPEELYGTPQSRYVASLIGATNLIDATVSEMHPGFASCRTRAGEFLARDPNAYASQGSAVTLSIRPEAWHLHPPPDASHPLTGHVVERSYLGSRTQYGIHTPAGLQQVMARNPHPPLEPGDAVTLHARPEDVVVLPPS
jgi:iron(III) transport system ATP-binding protein